MGLEYQNKKCQICQAYLFEDDDIVVCPICGAPHHRDCYSSLGRCGLEKYHNTDKQYDKTVKNDFNEQEPQKESRPLICASCGKKYDSNANNCPYCGANIKHSPFQQGPTFTPFGGGFIPFIDPLGGVPPETDIDGVNVGEIASFVGPNSPKYLYNFLNLSHGKKTSWNWAAFLFPQGWLFYRKMYKIGFFVLLLTIATTICLLPISREYTSILQTLPIQATQEEIASALSQSNILYNFAGILGIISFVISFAIRIVCGLFANTWYKNHVVTKIKKIKESDLEEGYDFAIKKSGGTNFFLLLITLFISENLIYILEMIL